MLSQLRTAILSLQTQRAGSTGEELRNWAIQFRPSEVEKAIWKKRNVNIFDLDLNDFVERMLEIIAEDPVTR